MLFLHLITKFLFAVAAGSVQNTKGCLNFPLTNLIYSQIWLNLLVDDQHQLGYITKLKK
jgi:hypothetical protein